MSSNLGTEYFITKPYNTHTLLDIMASILKRNYSINDMEIFEHNGLKYNMSTSQICFKGDEVELTKKESNILYTLIKNKGKIVSRDTIIKYLCQSNEFIDNSTLTINVNRLRRKIAGIGADGYLKTKRGKGYILL